MLAASGALGTLGLLFATAKARGLLLWLRLRGVRRHSHNRLKLLLRVQTGPNIATAGKNVTEQIELWGRDGYQPKSVSHACDPDGAPEDRSSVLLVSSGWSRTDTKIDLVLVS